MSKREYVLTLSEEQAKLLCTACEFYARMRTGQWNELIWHCLDLSKEDFCEKRDELEEKLMEARAIAFPDLAKHIGRHYGVGKFKEADQSWEIYEVLRHKIAWTEHPEGGYGVWFDKPMPFSGTPLAKCEVKEK